MTPLTLVEKFSRVQNTNTLLTLLNESRQTSVQQSTDTDESLRNPAIATLRSTSVHDDAFTLLAHDLSNKLNVILGYVEFLEESLHLHGARYDEEMLTRLKSGILSACTLVTHYRGLKLLPNGEAPLSPAPLLLGGILRCVEQQFTLEAQQRQVTLTVLVHDPLPMINGDAVALERVFTNLVHNALKFTPAQGRVYVTVITRNAKEVVVTVINTGPGITSEELPFLFHKYQQTAVGKAHGGAGLGLFIVKTLVEAHGGTISVDSGDCWTSFVVSFPIIT